MEEAGRFYCKVLRRQGENAESLAAMGLWALEQGDKKRAPNWLRAEDLDKDAARVALLRRRLGPRDYDCVRRRCAAAPRPDGASPLQARPSASRSTTLSSSSP